MATERQHERAHAPCWFACLDAQALRAQLASGRFTLEAALILAHALEQNGPR
jgi:hypothetical protein